MNKLVSVITATTGNKLLKSCIESVYNQSYRPIQHLIVIDGPDRYNDVREILDECKIKEADPEYRIDLIFLPYSIGKDRWNGHRIYGSGTYIADGDYVIFLDDDNSLQFNLVQDCINTVNAGNTWAYSLRQIQNKDEKFICLDDCESLGKWPSVLHPEDYFVDVNCYFLPKLLAVQISPLWYRKFREPGKPEIDRVICHALRQIAPNYDCTYEYSVMYTVANTGLSVTGEFFLHGNQEMKSRFKEGLPWKVKHLEKNLSDR